MDWLPWYSYTRYYHPLRRRVARHIRQFIIQENAEDSRRVSAIYEGIDGALVYADVNGATAGVPDNFFDKSGEQPVLRMFGDHRPCDAEALQEFAPFG